MATAIPPITGVGVPSLDSPARPERARRILSTPMNDALTCFPWLQMLRRGLVLDLSTAFGE